MGVEYYEKEVSFNALLLQITPYSDFELIVRAYNQYIFA